MLAVLSAIATDKDKMFKEMQIPEKQKCNNRLCFALFLSEEVLLNTGKWLWSDDNTSVIVLFYKKSHFFNFVTCKKVQEKRQGC